MYFIIRKLAIVRNLDNGIRPSVASSFPVLLSPKKAAISSFS